MRHRLRFITDLANWRILNASGMMGFPNMNDLFPPAAAKPAPPSAFAEFYARYPRKVGKGSARKAYAKALKAVSHDDIMFGLSQQLPGMEATDKKFIPHPATWLNRESWSDEPEEPTSKTGNGPGGASKFDEARERAMRSAARGPERGACGF